MYIYSIANIAVIPSPELFNISLRIHYLWQKLLSFDPQQTDNLLCFLSLMRSLFFGFNFFFLSLSSHCGSQLFQ